MPEVVGRRPDVPLQEDKRRRREADGLFRKATTGFEPVYEALQASA